MYYLFVRFVSYKPENADMRLHCCVDDMFLLQTCPFLNTYRYSLCCFRTDSTCICVSVCSVSWQTLSLFIVSDLVLHHVGHKKWRPKLFISLTFCVNVQSEVVSCYQRHVTDVYCHHYNGYFLQDDFHLTFS